MILEISITAKKEDTKAISYALQLIENGNTKRLPKSLAAVSYTHLTLPTISDV